MAGTIMNKVIELFTSDDYEEEEDDVLNNKGYSTDYEEDYEEEETEGKKLFGSRCLLCGRHAGSQSGSAMRQHHFAYPVPLFRHDWQ